MYGAAKSAILQGAKSSLKRATSCVWSASTQTHKTYR